MKKSKLFLSKEFSLNCVGTVLNSCISFVYLIIITRINNVSDAGIFSYCFAFSAILYTLTSYGGRTYQTSDSSNEFDDATYFTSRYVTSIMSFILAIIVFLIMNTALNKIIIILVLLMVRCIESFSDVCYAVFQKKNRLDLVGISLIFKISLNSIIFLFLSFTFNSLFINSIGILFGTIIVFFLFDRKYFKKLYKEKIFINILNIRNLLITTRYYCYFNLLIMIIANIPRFFVEKNFSDFEQGYFGIIMMIPTIMVLLGFIILQPLIVDISAYYKNKNYKKIKHVFFMISTITIFLTILCQIIFYFFGTSLFLLAYGIDFSGYKFIFIIVIFAGMFNVFTIYLSNILTIMRRTKEQIPLYFAGTLTCIIFMSIGLRFGFYGLFYSYAIYMIFQSILFYLYFIFKIKEEPKNEKS